jgi:ribonuclease HI
MTPRQRLTDSSLLSPDVTMFVDRSSILDDQGGCWATYTVVTIDSPRVLTATCLPMGTTSQKARLMALTQVLTIAQDKTANIYTDSKYASLITHSHAAIWKERGFLTTRGTPVVNGPLIAKLLWALELPREVTIIHCRGHQTSNDLVAWGNSFADLTVRKTAEQSILPPILFLSPSFTPNYEPEEQATQRRGNYIPQWVGLQR